MKRIKTFISCILTAVNLFSFSACGGDKVAELSQENQALQQQIEALEQQNSSIQADKENLQNEIEGITSVLPEKQEELKKYKEIVEGDIRLYGGDQFFSISLIAPNNKRIYLGVMENRERFDINNVTINLYYGTDFEEGFTKYYTDEYTISVGTWGNLIPVKVIKENYYVEENRAESIYNEDNEVKGAKCKRFEEVVIPAEVFNKDYGSLIFSMSLTMKDSETGKECGKVMSDSEHYFFLNYYKSLDGSQVLLSTYPELYTTAMYSS